MTGHLKIRSPRKQLGVLTLCALPLLITMFLNILFSNEEVKIDLTRPGAVESLKWSQIITSVAFFFFPAFLFAVFTFRSKQFYFLGFRNPEKPNMFILAAICALVVLPAMFWLGQLNQGLPISEQLRELEKTAGKTMETILKVNSPLDVVINLIVVALVPAFCEEIFFRGAVQRVLIHLTKSPWAGIIITGVLFSAMHFQFLGFLPRAVLGIVLGVLYWYSGSLWTSIIAHFVINAVQVIAVSYMPKYVNENPQMPLLSAIVSAVAVCVILWYFKNKSTVTWSKVYDTDGLTPTNQFIA
jgi:membrane protease YdiL (CAAX protease family)